MSMGMLVSVLVAVAAVLVPGLVMALTRVVATVNAAVVMVAVFSSMLSQLSWMRLVRVLTSRQLCCHHSYSLSSQSRLTRPWSVEIGCRHRVWKGAAKAIP